MPLPSAPSGESESPSPEQSLPEIEPEAQRPDPQEPFSAAGRPADFVSRLVAHWALYDAVLFAVYAGLCILSAAALFYRSLHAQTGGEWSAPLDDVFIHFDYARATARGFPFEWSEGNGFSSGNTSILYPFVLAPGYWIGFRGLELMLWAAWIACLSVFAFFLASKALFEPLGRWAKYLMPPVVLSVGALNWSLWSGMENALHLGVWGLCLGAALSLIGHLPQGPSAEPKPIAGRALLLGFSGVLLYFTRPESAVCIAAFAIFTALSARRALGLRAAAITLVCASLPGVLALVLHSTANRVFTGEWSSAGAITKLALNHPYMSADQKWQEYLSHLKYVVLRLCQHHFSDIFPVGYLVPLTALIGLSDKRIRAYVITVYIQVIAWLATVSLNGQVRWQNERYTMSAVAWLLMLSALGLAALVNRPGNTLQTRGFWLARIASAIAIMTGFYVCHQDNIRDQVWFFGRACRNIRDQHVIAGRMLAAHKPRRILVGDAGALIYIADRPGLDLIGLGGYHDFPFARANVHGLGASIELIERLPDSERPDYMALYPGWWGEFVGLFGRRVAQVPVIGNVICGGAEKVIYRADFSALDQAGRPRSLADGERIIDELDIADLVSERAHNYVFPRPGMGFVVFRVLPDPEDPNSDLFDAGRIVPAGRSETATLQAPSGPGRLIVRAIAGESGTLEIRADGQPLGRLHAGKQRGWSETSIELPPGLRSPFSLELYRADGDFTAYHLWVTEGRAGHAHNGRLPE